MDPKTETGCLSALPLTVAAGSEQELWRLPLCTATDSRCRKWARALKVASLHCHWQSLQEVSKSFQGYPSALPPTVAAGSEQELSRLPSALPPTVAAGSEQELSRLPLCTATDSRCRKWALSRLPLCTATDSPAGSEQELSRLPSALPPTVAAGSEQELSRLPLCTATDCRCRKWARAFTSSVLWPRSSMTAIKLGPKTLTVSLATRVKEWPWSKLVHWPTFSFLLQQLHHW